MNRVVILEIVYESFVVEKTFSAQYGDLIRSPQLVVGLVLALNILSGE